jgi:hypothetical protein
MMPLIIGLKVNAFVISFISIPITSGRGILPDTGMNATITAKNMNINMNIRQ